MVQQRSQDTGAGMARAWRGHGASMSCGPSTSLERPDSDLTREVLNHARPAMNVDRPEPAETRSRGFRGSSGVRRRRPGSKVPGVTGQARAAPTQMARRPRHAQGKVPSGRTKAG
eukprot:gene15896-biopygen20223